MLQDAIRELRKKHNLSQVQFAKRLNVTQGAVSQWEKGATRPDTDMLARISSEFGIGIDDLMQGEVRETAEAFKRRPLTDDDIKFALWGADAQNITKAQFDQVKAFAKFIGENENRRD